MATEKHMRSIHIDAPVETVFRHIEDPAHFIAAMAASHHARLGGVDRTPEGVVTHYQCIYRELGHEMKAIFTRDQYVVNERIVDRSSAGPIHMLAVETDPTGTTLSYAWEAPRWMKMLDALLAHSDKDVENALTFFKHEVEARS